MIRAVSPADASAIFEISESAHQLSTSPIGARWGIDQVRNESGVAFEEAGKLEAFILFRDVVDALEIEFLATAPEARGKGRMLKLLQHMLEVRPPGKAIWLEVHELNEPARQLYEKAGFKIVGKRPRYYSDGGAAILYNYS